MLPRRRALVAGTAAAAATSVLARPARAAWPDRPLTMIVAFPAGGGTDVAARTLARFLERDLGQPVAVINRAGAGGEIGFTELARARPDGYTIGFINTPSIVTIPIERQAARFRLDDFAPMANVVDDPGSFFVNADSPLKNLADLVAHARANPERVSVGTSGIGSDDHLAMLAFQRLTGVRMTHIPYAGSAQVKNAILARTITIAAMNIAEGVNDMRQGQLRALGQMGERRWSEAADVPTFREQGFDVIEGSMRGLAAPAGVPREVLDRVAGAARAAIADPEFQRLAQGQALPLRYLGPDDYRKELVALRDAYQRLWDAHPWRE